MDALYLWIPTFVAGFILMIAGFILTAKPKKPKNGDAPSNPA